jgi:hypothetical protein
MNKSFSLYCDESTHLRNDGMPYMLISYVGSANNEIKLHSHNIKELKLKHKIKGEMKWSGISTAQYSFYADVIDYFFATDLYFRSVIVEKKQIQGEVFGLTYDDFYFRMYYQLLHHKINMAYEYDVYLDIKDTCSANKIKKLKEILNIRYGRIRRLQFMHSYESNLLQLCDVLMGAINYKLRGEQKVISKNKIIEKISHHTQLALNHSTSKSAEKFNLFFIDLKK